MFCVRFIRERSHEETCDCHRAEIEGRTLVRVLLLFATYPSARSELPFISITSRCRIIHDTFTDFTICTLPLVLCFPSRGRDTEVGLNNGNIAWNVGYWIVEIGSGAGHFRDSACGM